MPMTINCPHCQAKVRAPESLIGKKVKCPTCKEQFTVEAEAAEAPAPAPVEQLAIKQEAYAESKPPAPPDDDDDDADEEEKPRRRKRGRGGDDFADFVFFRKMITPFVVQVVYFIASGAVILGGLVQMGLGLFALINGQIMAMLIGFFGGMLLIAIGLVLVRIYCETLILFFRMYDVAKEIREELQKRP